MTLTEVASHFNARRIGRGKYVAKCTAHPDNKPSLSIWEGRTGVMLKCMSMGCDTRDVVKAAGLTMAALFYDSERSPQDKRRAAAQRAERERLTKLEAREAILMWMHALDPTAYTRAALKGIAEDIQKERDRRFPDEARMRRFHAAVDRLGWDGIWERFLLTEKGKAALARAEGR